MGETSDDLRARIEKLRARAERAKTERDEATEELGDVRSELIVLKEAVREWFAASLVVAAARKRIETAEATYRASETVLDEAETDAGRRLAQETAEHDGEALDDAVAAGHTALDRLDELSQRVRTLIGEG